MKELNNLPHSRNIFGIDDLALGTLGAGIISGIGSFFGGKSASDSNLQAQRETNEMQMKMFQQQMDYNRAAEDRARSYALEDFDMENQYNSAAAQRQRFEQAGLNPALMMQGQGASSGQIEATSASSAPSAPQLGAPVQQDYITPAMQQMVNGMIGFSQAQKNAEEAAGIASDTRVKAATEQLRIKQAFQENQKRIYELRSMKHLPKIKEMELKNLQEQNRILQDTNAVLDMTQDARVKSQETMNYLNDSLARKYDAEYRAQEIKNKFVRFHEENKIKIDERTIDSIAAGIQEAASRTHLNYKDAALKIMQENNLNPNSEVGKQLYRFIESQIHKNYYVDGVTGYKVYNPRTGKYEIIPVDTRRITGEKNTRW